MSAAAAPPAPSSPHLALWVAAYGLCGMEPAPAPVPEWAVIGPALQCNLISPPTMMDSGTDQSENQDVCSVTGERRALSREHGYTGVRPVTAVATLLY